MASKREAAGSSDVAMKDVHISDSGAKPWTWRLNLFLRTLGVLQFVKGLAYWAALLSAGGAPDPMHGVSTVWLVTAAFFAVADPVAAVGLWLRAAWGVAIWMLAAIGQIVALSSEAQFTTAALVLTGVAMAAMLIYVVLSTKARGEID